MTRKWIRTNSLMRAEVSSFSHFVILRKGCRWINLHCCRILQNKKLSIRGATHAHGRVVKRNGFLMSVSIRRNKIAFRRKDEHKSRIRGTDECFSEAQHFTNLPSRWSIHNALENFYDELEGFVWSELSSSIFIINNGNDIKRIMSWELVVAWKELNFLWCQLIFIHQQRGFSNL